MRLASRRTAWLGLAVVGLAALGLYLHFDLGHQLTLKGLKASRDSLIALYGQRPFLFAAGFFALYVVFTALSIPGAVLLTLAAGAILGLLPGLVLVSFASSLGATLAFLASRYLLRGPVQARFEKRLGAVDEGMRRDGAFYLLTLRLVPLFPFVLVNLLVGLTSISAARFYWVSQLGMLPGTAVYVNAGKHLANIERLGDVLSPGVLTSFVLLAAFPLIAKIIVSGLRRRAVYASWQRPPKFDRNLVVIGAGAGGLITAYIAAAVKAKVTLIESHRMGGDCLNYGCVPSKTLIRTAAVMRQFRDAASLGIATQSAATVDFGALMARIRCVIEAIAPHDSVERYTTLGVDVAQGEARIVSPWSVEIKLAGGEVRTLTTRSIVIATGSRPLVPPITGLADAGFLTSETLWDLTEQPRRLVVLGGGPVGCELAQSFARLGTHVTLVEKAPRLMVREDPDAAALVADSLRQDGVVVLTGHEALRCEQVGAARHLVVVAPGERERLLEFDQLLCAVGRSPRVEGFGLEALGIAPPPGKTIETNAYLETIYPNVYAVGDVAGPFQFTHTAAHQAWYAAVNALFGRFRRFKADYSVIPWATFTDPEVARVGLSENEAKEQDIAVEVTRFELQHLDRSIVDGTAYGFVKVLTVPGKDRILGVTIVGSHAGDLIAEYVLAMKYGLGLNKILATIHTYPTLAEASRSLAGEWKRTHAPQRLLAWAARYHAWERG